MLTGTTRIEVIVTSSNGDSETLTLTLSGVETCSTTIDSAAGTPTASDGVIQAALGDTLTDSYFDSDDEAANVFRINSLKNRPSCLDLFFDD